MAYRPFGTGKHGVYRCVYCGRTGARSHGPYGRAHKACIPAEDRKILRDREKADAIAKAKGQS